MSDDTLIAEGETLHVITDKDQKVKSIPGAYKLLLTEDSDLAFPADQAPR